MQVTYTFCDSCNSENEPFEYSLQVGPGQVCVPRKHLAGGVFVGTQEEALASGWESSDYEEAVCPGCLEERGRTDDMLESNSNDITDAISGKLLKEKDSVAKEGAQSKVKLTIF